MKLNLGDFVHIKAIATGLTVFKGFAIGCNDQVIITVDNPCLDNPKAYVTSDACQISYVAPVHFDYALLMWIDNRPKYKSFDATQHSVEIIQANQSAFKFDASIIYDFEKNEWTKKGYLGRTTHAIDDPLPPLENVIIKFVGSENILCLINGITVSVKNPNIVGVNETGKLLLGKYNLVKDHAQEGMLIPVLIEDYETECRQRIVEDHRNNYSLTA